MPNYFRVELSRHIEQTCTVLVKTDKTKDELELVLYDSETMNRLFDKAENLWEDLEVQVEIDMFDQIEEDEVDEESACDNPLVL